MMDKARIAAIAGALSYIGAERAGVMPAAEATVTAAAQPGSSAWALYGRQNQMNLRSMMQRRERRYTR